MTPQAPSSQQPRSSAATAPPPPQLFAFKPTGSAVWPPPGAKSASSSSSSSSLQSRRVLHPATGSSTANISQSSSNRHSPTAPTRPLPEESSFATPTKRFEKPQPIDAPNATATSPHHHQQQHSIDTPFRSPNPASYMPSNPPPNHQFHISLDSVPSHRSLASVEDSPTQDTALRMLGLKDAGSNARMTNQEMRDANAMASPLVRPRGSTDALSPVPPFNAAAAPSSSASTNNPRMPLITGNMPTSNNPRLAGHARSSSGAMIPPPSPSPGYYAHTTSLGLAAPRNDSLNSASSSSIPSPTGIARWTRKDSTGSTGSGSDTSSSLDEGVNFPTSSSSAMSTATVPSISAARTQAITSFLSHSHMMTAGWETRSQPGPASQFTSGDLLEEIDLLIQMGGGIEETLLVLVYLEMQMKTRGSEFQRDRPYDSLKELMGPMTIICERGLLSSPTLRPQSQSSMLRSSNSGFGSGSSSVGSSGKFPQPFRLNQPRNYSSSSSSSNAGGGGGSAGASLPPRSDRRTQGTSSPKHELRALAQANAYVAWNSAQLQNDDSQLPPSIVHTIMARDNSSYPEKPRAVRLQNETPVKDQAPASTTSPPPVPLSPALEIESTPTPSTAIYTEQSHPTASPSDTSGHALSILQEVSAISSQEKPQQQQQQQPSAEILAAVSAAQQSAKEAASNPVAKLISPKARVVKAPTESQVNTPSPSISPSPLIGPKPPLKAMGLVELLCEILGYKSEYHLAKHVTHAQVEWLREQSGATVQNRPPADDTPTATTTVTTASSTATSSSASSAATPATPAIPPENPDAPLLLFLRLLLFENESFPSNFEELCLRIRQDSFDSFLEKKFLGNLINHHKNELGLSRIEGALSHADIRALYIHSGAGRYTARLLHNYMLERKELHSPAPSPAGVPAVISPSSSPCSTLRPCSATNSTPASPCAQIQFETWSSFIHFISTRFDLFLASRTAEVKVLHAWFSRTQGGDSLCLPSLIGVEKDKEIQMSDVFQLLELIGSAHMKPQHQHHLQQGSQPPPATGEASTQLQQQHSSVADSPVLQTTPPTVINTSNEPARPVTHMSGLTLLYFMHQILTTASTPSPRFETLSELCSHLHGLINNPSVAAANKNELLACINEKAEQQSRNSESAKQHVIVSANAETASATRPDSSTTPGFVSPMAVPSASEVDDWFQLMYSAGFNDVILNILWKISPWSSSGTSSASTLPTPIATTTSATAFLPFAPLLAKKISLDEKDLAALLPPVFTLDALSRFCITKALSYRCSSISSESSLIHCFLATHTPRLLPGNCREEFVMNQSLIAPTEAASLILYLEMMHLRSVIEGASSPVPVSAQSTAYPDSDSLIQAIGELCRSEEGEGEYTQNTLTRLYPSMNQKDIFRITESLFTDCSSNLRMVLHYPEGLTDPEFPSMLRLFLTQLEANAKNESFHFRNLSLDECRASFKSDWYECKLILHHFLAFLPVFSLSNPKTPRPFLQPDVSILDWQLDELYCVGEGGVGCMKTLRAMQEEMAPIDLSFLSPGDQRRVEPSADWSAFMAHFRAVFKRVTTAEKASPKNEQQENLRHMSIPQQTLYYYLSHPLCRLLPPSVFKSLTHNDFDRLLYLGRPARESLELIHNDDATVDSLSWAFHYLLQLDQLDFQSDIGSGTGYLCANWNQLIEMIESARVESSVKEKQLLAYFNSSNCKLFAHPSPSAQLVPGPPALALTPSPMTQNPSHSKQPSHSSALASAPLVLTPKNLYRFSCYVGGGLISQNVFRALGLEVLDTDDRPYEEFFAFVRKARKKLGSQLVVPSKQAETTTQPAKVTTQPEESSKAPEPATKPPELQSIAPIAQKAIQPTPPTSAKTTPHSAVRSVVQPVIQPVPNIAQPAAQLSAEESKKPEPALRVESGGARSPNLSITVEKPKEIKQVQVDDATADEDEELVAVLEGADDAAPATPLTPVEATSPASVNRHTIFEYLTSPSCPLWSLLAPPPVSQTDMDRLIAAAGKSVHNLWHHLQTLTLQGRRVDSVLGLQMAVLKHTRIASIGDSEQLRAYARSGQSSGAHTPTSASKPPAHSRRHSLQLPAVWQASPSHASPSQPSAQQYMQDSPVTKFPAISRASSNASSAAGTPLSRSVTSSRAATPVTEEEEEAYKQQIVQFCVQKNCPLWQNGRMVRLTDAQLQNLISLGRGAKATWLTLEQLARSRKKFEAYTALSFAVLKATRSKS